tara:strand:- start:171 stop:575 length:405 start_codon:yes stop_codon:yes gene_type:complete
MADYFATVKNYINDLNLKIVNEDTAEELVVIDDEENGIKNLIVDCEDPILIVEQTVFPLSKRAKTSSEILLRLLQMNRHLVHGAFVVDESGSQVIYRDTLQLANLDLNELEGSINALSLGLAEFGGEIIEMAQG